MKKIFYLVLSTLFFFIIPIKSSASTENFSTSYNVTYNVSETGSTNTIFNITLVNNTENFYASSYSIDLGLDDIRDIKASDIGGSIAPKVIKTSEGNKVDLKFNKRVVGKGNAINFNLSFNSDNIASRQGKIWEVNIPGISSQNDFSTFNVHVNVPKSFGTPSYIKPSQNSNSLDFTKDQLGKSGISIAFGRDQIYNFTLKYHLKNPNIFPVKTEIALPPTTNYQDVYIDDINPLPSNVITDSDGNWLAQYRLIPSQVLNVIVKGKTRISLLPKKEVLNQNQLAMYLKEDKFWETKNSKIKELAASLKTPYAIYEYVVKNLSYDFSRVTQSKPRLGAVNALNSPSSAVCLEFTDLFVALARAAGIPAREVDGYANTQNPKQRPVALVKDILHAWPEYYDSEAQTWIMVDPTWGNTTGGTDFFDVLDFDHLAFVIKGKDSTYPIPAGGYKLSGSQNIKDVEISFGDQELENVQQFEIESNIPQKSLSGMVINGTVTVKNIGKGLLGPQNVEVSSDNLTPVSQTISFSEIPPFGSSTVSINFNKTPFLTNKKATVKIRTEDKEISSTITISPFTISREILIGGITGAIFIIAIFIIARRARNLSLFKQKG